MNKQTVVAWYKDTENNEKKKKKSTNQLLV